MTSYRRPDCCTHGCRAWEHHGSHHRRTVLWRVQRLHHWCVNAGYKSLRLRSLRVYLCTCTGHVVPEARVGGPIGLVRDGDRIVIDSESRTISWDVDEEEQARRRKEWEASDKGKLTAKRGILFRYARDVAVSAFDRLLWWI